MLYNFIMKVLFDSKLKNNFIEQHALKENLSNNILNALELQLFEMGEFIYHQDDEAHTFYILVEGKLQIDYLHPNGNQTIFSIGEPLATLGDLELFETFPAVKNVFVMEKSTLLAAPINIVRKFGGEDHRFLRFILHQIVKKLDFSSNQLAQTSLPLKSRLSRYILGQFSSKGTMFTLERRDVLAGILGCSVRHLNRTLKALSEEKIIKVHNKTVKIIAPEQLSIAVQESLQKGT